MHAVEFLFVSAKELAFHMLHYQLRRGAPRQRLKSVSVCPREEVAELHIGYLELNSSYVSSACPDEARVLLHPASGDAATASLRRPPGQPLRGCDLRRAPGVRANAVVDDERDASRRNAKDDMEI